MMTKRIVPRTVVAAAVLVATSHGLHAADFHEGLAAYVRGDFETALREWRPLAAGGDPEAQFRLARMYYHGEGVRDDAEAAKWYRKAAQQGHAKAQNNLGMLYEKGRGVDRDDAEAARWYRKAAELGLVTAQGNLGRMYDDGQGVERDPAEAARWYRAAAEQGHVRSQYRLGVMFEEGTGVSQDLVKAANWYRRAAKQDHALAQAAIGSMYAEGRGVSRDLQKAMKWLGRASAQGVAVAPLASTEFLEVVPVRDEAAPVPPDEAAPDPEVTGDQVEPPLAPRPTERPEPAVPRVPAAVTSPSPPPEPPSRERDVSPLEFTNLREVGRRAEEGDAGAQYRLAQMYSTGDGAPQSLDHAARWYLRAAEQGHDMAAYKLGFLYLRGRGVPRKDFVQAYRWFSVAAGLGVGDAGTWRDKIRKKMTEQEIAEAERLAGQAGER